MAANWEGFLFFKDLIEGDQAFLSKVDGKWQQVRTFSFRDYVTPDWDEVINPSFAVNQRAYDRVQKNIRATCASDSAFYKRMKGTKPIMEGTYAPLEHFYSRLRFNFDCGDRQPLRFLDLF